MDRYSKIVFTVIAAALSMIAYGQLKTGSATAQIILGEPATPFFSRDSGEPCGATLAHPCFVEIAGLCGSKAKPCYFSYDRGLFGQDRLPVQVGP